MVGIFWASPHPLSSYGLDYLGDPFSTVAPNCNRTLETSFRPPLSCWFRKIGAYFTGHGGRRDPDDRGRSQPSCPPTQGDFWSSGLYPGAGSPQKNTKQNSVDGRCRRTRQPDLSRPRQGIESTGGRCPSAGVIRRKIRGGCRKASLGQNPLHCRLVILRLSFKEEFLDQRSWCYFEYTDDERVLENMAFSVSFDASLRSPPLPEESGSPDRKRVG